MIPKIGDIIKHNLCYSEVKITAVGKDNVNSDYWVLSCVMYDAKGCEICLAETRDIIPLYIRKTPYEELFRKRTNVDTEIL